MSRYLTSTECLAVWVQIWFFKHHGGVWKIRSMKTRNIKADSELFPCLCNRLSHAKEHRCFGKLRQNYFSFDLANQFCSITKICNKFNSLKVHCLAWASRLKRIPSGKLPVPLGESLISIKMWWSLVVVVHRIAMDKISAMVECHVALPNSWSSSGSH